MSGGMGVLGIIAAALALGSSKSGKQPGKIYGIPDITPAVTPTTGSNGITRMDQVGIPPTIKTSSWTEPTTTSSVLSAAITTLGSPSTIAAVKTPAVVVKKYKTVSAITGPEPQVTTPIKASGWTWQTPQGPVTSRPQTPEEQESGIGCPEVPGIWDMSKYSLTALRYCSNPQCPSNQREWVAVSAEGPHWSEPTPAVLEQEVDKNNKITYYCRVCRNRTT